MRSRQEKKARRRLTVKTFSGLAAVHGPSFESLDSEDFLSPLATGVSGFQAAAVHVGRNWIKAGTCTVARQPPEALE